MDPKVRDSYLKNPPDSRNFSRRIARIRQKGYHAEARPGEGNELDASAVYIVQPGSNPIIGMRPWGDGTPTWARDAALNSSDKSYTVPEGKTWDLRSVLFTILSTATVGNRTIRCRITDLAGGILVPTSFMDNVAASVSSSGGWYFGTNALAGAIGHIRLDTGGDVGLANATRSEPPCILTAGQTVRVLDSAAVDAAADDMTVVLHYVEYDA